MTAKDTIRATHSQQKEKYPCEEELVSIIPSHSVIMGCLTILGTCTSQVSRDKLFMKPSLTAKIQYKIFRTHLGAYICLR